MCYALRVNFPEGDMDDEKTSDTPTLAEAETSQKPIGALVTDLLVGAAAAGTRTVVESVVARVTNATKPAKVKKAAVAVAKKAKKAVKKALKKTAKKSRKKTAKKTSKKAAKKASKKAVKKSSKKSPAKKSAKKKSAKKPAKKSKARKSRR
jgi:hypothetical protein